MRDDAAANRLCRWELTSGWLDVWRSGSLRSLWFDDDIMPSQIDLKRPSVIPNPANRRMLANL